jgi:hypothetical protein
VAGPREEDEVGAHEVEFLEEAGAPPANLAGLLPERFQAVANGMECEGQKVREYPGQAFVLMPKVVRQVVACARSRSAAPTSLTYSVLRLSFLQT